MWLFLQIISYIHKNPFVLDSDCLGYFIISTNNKSVRIYEALLSTSHLHFRSSSHFPLPQRNGRYSIVSPAGFFVYLRFTFLQDLRFSRFLSPSINSRYTTKGRVGVVYFLSFCKILTFREN